MKTISFVIVLLFGCCSTAAFAQNEFLNKSNTLAPPGSSLGTPKTNSPSVFSLNTKPATSSSSTIETKKIQFANTNDFANPGDVYKKKFNEDIKEDYYSRIKIEYFGNFKTHSESVTISYRDYDQVDFDQVGLYVNDELIVEKIDLEESFKSFKLGLKKGLNKIFFEALNEGLGSPNTGEFIITDEDGNIISSNKWGLFTRDRGSISIIRE